VRRSQCARPIVNDVDLVAEQFEEHLERVGSIRVVLDDEDAGSSRWCCWCCLGLPLLRR